MTGMSLLWSLLSIEKVNEEGTIIRVKSLKMRRKGFWKNNLASDYDALYEAMTGMIEENEVNAEKFARLRERGFYQNGKVQTVIVKGDYNAFFSLIPKADPSITKLFTDFALENAMAEAKDYPTQMQDLVVAEHEPRVCKDLLGQRFVHRH